MALDVEAGELSMDAPGYIDMAGLDASVAVGRGDGVERLIG